MTAPDLTVLLERFARGDRVAAARLMSIVENGEQADARRVLTALYGKTGQAHIVGITGAPGTGKSTLVNALTKVLRQRQRTVGIVAIDPSSPFTGGAILGDRIRMQDAAVDPGVFIRSMATRGSLGGLARATADVVRILDAFGRDIILVETVGVGQDEVDITRMAHTTVVVQMPTLGDDIQALKAGILEIADILVINKADLPGVERVSAALEMMLELNPITSRWRVPILRTIATQGTGLDALADAIDRHYDFLRSGSGFIEREERRIRSEILSLLQQELTARTLASLPYNGLDEIVAQVRLRSMDPYTAVDTLIQQATQGLAHSRGGHQGG